MDKQNVKSNYLFNLFYQILCIITPLITAPYISRVLNADGIGIFSWCNSFSTYFTIFISFGFNLYLQTMTSKYRDDKYQQSRIFYSVTIIKAAFTVISIFIYTLLSIFLFKGYIVFLLIFIVNLISTFVDFSSFFAGNNEYKMLAVRSSIFKVATIILILTMVKTENDLWLYCLIFVVGNLLSNLSVLPFLKKYLVKVKLSELTYKEHLINSFQFLIPTISVTLFLTIDKTMIGFLVQGETSVLQNGVETIVKTSELENGYFEQADKIIRILLTLLTSLNTVMLTKNSYALNHGGEVSVRENVNKTLKLFLMLSIPMGFGIAGISNNFINWFLGDGYEKAGLLLSLMAILLVTTSLNSCLSNQYLYPAGKQMENARNIVISNVIGLICAIPLIVLFKSIGAVIAIIIYDLVLLFFNMVSSREVIDFKSLFVTFVRYLVYGLAMFVPVFIINKLFANTLFMFASIVIGILIYVLLMILFKDENCGFVLNKFLGSKKIFTPKEDKNSIGKRIVWIDYLRFIAIFMVVLGHGLFEYGIYNYGILKVIYSIHMPLFFMISGYLFRISEKLSFGQFIKKQLVKLLIPYLLFCLFTVLFQFLMCKFVSKDMSYFDQFTDINVLLNTILLTFNSLFSKYWFIPCMFVSNVCMFFINKIKKEHITFILMGVFLILGFVAVTFNSFALPFCLNDVPLTLFYMLCGVQIKKIDFGNKKIVCLLLLISSLLFGVFSTISIVNKVGLDNYYNMDIPNYVLFILNSLSGSLILFCLCSFLDKIESKVISYIGKSTLYIYGFHYFVQNILSMVFINTSNYSFNILLAFIYSLLNVIIIVVILWLLKIVKRNFFKMIS